MQGWETKERNNVDWRIEEEIREEGDENKEQFSNNEIQRVDVVSRY